MDETIKEEMRERMGNIDLIRDIIFGSKLQEYDSRLEKLESKFSSLEQEMRDRTLAVKSECLAELQASVESLEQKIKSLSLTTQRDNVEVRQLIDRSYKNFSISLESIDKTLISQNTSIRKDLSETKENFQEDIRRLKSEVFDELEKRFSRLTDAKVSRNDMADLLFELGLKMKGTEFAPKLREGSNPNGTDDLRLIEASKISE